MKRYPLLCFLLLPVLPAMAQTGDWVVTIRGDTLRGKIEVNFDSQEILFNDARTVPFRLTETFRIAEGIFEIFPADDGSGLLILKVITLGKLSLYETATEGSYRKNKTTYPAFKNTWYYSHGDESYEIVTLRKLRLAVAGHEGASRRIRQAGWLRFTQYALLASGFCLLVPGAAIVATETKVTGGLLLLGSGACLALLNKIPAVLKLKRVIAGAKEFNGRVIE